MADAGVIIKADLKEEDLTRKIDKLVQDVDNKFKDMADKVDASIQKVATSLGNFKTIAQTNVQEIKNAFQQLGTTFDQFARAMEKAAAAASGGKGVGGSGGSSGSVSAPNFDSAQTVGELEKMIKQQEKYIKTLELGTEELKKQVALMEQQVLKKKQMTTSSISKDYKNAMSYYPSSKDIAVLQDRLMRLSTVYSKIRDEAIRTGKSMGEIFPQDKINRLNSAIDTTRQKIERLREAASKPTTTKGGSILPTNMTDVMGMSEKTLDEIALKMKAISQLRAQTPIGSKDIKELNNEYTRLSKLQSEVLGKNKALVESTSSLGRAFNYIKNRLAFALTIGALTGFVRQLYEIRGQYELLERSLGVLLDSFSTGSRIFNELNQMAIQSPFTLIELGTAAKQLTAYNFEAREVVDTTRRLADISSALGVPMERLVYNLGQIRAQTVLTSRDARDFANAGLAIVPELAKYYTELEGKVVSTADVFDRMKKKAVSYNDVMSVLYKITDEGGKFFDFQAKQAGTLKVQLANLNLAWNNLLNDLGKSNQGLLSFPVQGLREAFLHWKDIANIIETAVVGLGAYKLAQFAITNTVGTTARQMIASAKAEARANVTRLERIRLTRALTESEDTLLTRSKLLVANQRTMSEIDYIAALSATKMTKLQAMTLVALNKKNDALQTAMVRTNLLTQAEVKQALAMGRTELLWKRLSITMKGFFSTMKAMIFTPTTAFMAALTIGMDIYNTWNEAKEAVRQFNQEVAKASSESSNSITEFLSSKTISKFTDPEKLKDASSEEVQKTWEAIKEEIIKSSAAGMDFVSALESIKNMNQRVSNGFDYLNKIQAVHGALEEIDDETIAIQQDWSKWWNLDMGVDSLKENLEQYIDYLHVIANVLGSVEEAKKDAASGEPVSKDAIEELNKYLETLQGNIDETVDSMLNLFMNKNFDPAQEREGFNKITDQLIQDMNLSVEQGLILRNQLEQRYAERRFALYKEENAKQASTNYDFWQKQFNTRQSFEDDFLKWMSRNHRSEVQKMFGDMTRAEIEQIDWSTPKWKQWAETNATEFARQYNLSFEDLRHLVNNANSWSVRIPVFFDFLGLNKSFYQQLTDADSAVSDAEKRIKRLQEAINSGKLSQRELEKANDELKTAQDDLDKALKEHGKSSQKATKSRGGTTKAAKAQKQAEDAVAKALREEISVINEMQGSYDKLRKAGVGTTDALTIASSGYDKTLKSINATLSKYGISPFKAEDFVGSSDPHKLLKALQDQLNTLVKSGKVKTASLKDLEMEIKKITVDAREYDMKKITDGLNNELGKIKEEYELAVELEANPELGQLFAESFGIDTTNFPKTVQEAVDMMQDATDKAIAEYAFGEGVDVDVNDLMHTFDILHDDIEKWAKETGVAMDSNLVQALKQMQKQARDLVEKDAKQTIQDWQNLLEKYAEYETKKAEIQRKAEQERETARKHGASQEIFDAIDLKEVRGLAKLDFDEFQKTAYWITATGDLSRLSNSALQILIDKLGEYKKSAKNLDPKDIFKLNNAMRKLRNEQRKNNPFSAFSISIDEAQERMEQFEPYIQDYEKEIKKLWEKEIDEGGLSEEDQKRLEKYVKKYKELVDLQKEVGKVPFADKMKDIGKVVNAFKGVADTFKQIADSTNDFNLKQTADAISDVIGNFEAAEQGAQTWGGWWGAIIGGVTDAIPKIMKWVSGNNTIDYDIQQSQIQVKKLTNFYKELEAAANKAYGVEAYGAQKAMLINKEFQLEALKAQLRLEKSRKKKYQDQSTIADLEGQIIDLKNEINEATENIVNDLLGITSKADFAENLVSSMIDAFKAGEDYMKVFEESFEDMVDNMIMKAIVSRLVGDWINSIWDNVNAKVAQSDRVREAEKNLKEAESKLQGFEELANESPTYTNLQLRDMWRKKYEEALAAYNAAITPTPEDIAGMREFFEQGRDDFKNNFLAYMDAFGIKFGEGAGKADLSALQQGIQGITEDTAGALEAYMNSVSQQVYLHSDLLTQIRDILINFGGDVTIATNAQILFELQQSFQVQMTIQSILQGWSNASGLAMRVELVS